MVFQCVFCARFLPSLVSAYKAALHVDSPYHRMLVGVSQSLYFAKFMRSPLGSDLYTFFVDEIVRQVRTPCEVRITIRALTLVTPSACRAAPPENPLCPSWAC